MSHIRFGHMAIEPEVLEYSCFDQYFREGSSTLGEPVFTVSIELRELIQLTLLVFFFFFFVPASSSLLSSSSTFSLFEMAPP
jgi:hypothetical protein